MGGWLDAIGLQSHNTANGQAVIEPKAVAATKKTHFRGSDANRCTMSVGVSRGPAHMIRPKAAAVCSDNAVVGASQALFSPQGLFFTRHRAIDGMRG
jgi:hypothetical protein